MASDDDLKSELARQYADPSVVRYSRLKEQTNTFARNPFAPPPKPPWHVTGEVAEPREVGLPQPPRVQSEVAENLSPTMGAYGATNTGAQFLEALYSGDHKTASELAPLVAGTMAGMKANKANIAKLREGLDLWKKGWKPEDIWGETGWGMPRTDKEGGNLPFWDLSDKRSEYRAGVGNTAMALSNLPGYPRMETFWKHPELFANYPEFRKMLYIPMEHSELQKLKMSGGYGADLARDLRARGVFPTYQRDDLMIMPANDLHRQGKSSLRSVKAHEDTHAAAKEEGFDTGINPKSDIIAARIADLKTELEHMAATFGGQRAHYTTGLANKGYQPGAAGGDMGAVWDTLNPGKAYLLNLATKVLGMGDDGLKQMAYLTKAGEMNARAAQARLDWTDKKRKDTPWWKSYDMPEQLMWYSSEYPDYNPWTGELKNKPKP